jgi:hypothetical protein
MNITHVNLPSSDLQTSDQSTLPRNDNKQATEIQKIFRGFQARKSFLPSSLYPAYSTLCKNIDESVPRAEGGKVEVYLPPSLPEVVIKKTGIEDSKNRVFKAEAIRSIVHSENLTNLIVPRSRLCGEFLVEERLPICIDPGYNAMLYVKNKDLFDAPVRQMTRLFSMAYIDYLVQKSPEDDSLLRIRYDNIPFILRERKGEMSVDIGLIDLERSKVGSAIKSTSHKLFILASIFPYHTALIEEEGLKMSMVIGEREKEVMRKAAFHSKEYLEKKCAEYLAS